MTNDTTCKLDECAKPVKRAGYCYSHYMKNWRYGTPTPVFEKRWVDIQGQRFGSLIVIERVGDKWRCACDCGRDRLASAGELNREGQSNTCGDRYTHRRRNDSGYGAAHERVKRDRGPIRSQQCIDCEAPARHWSYNHDDPNELFDTELSTNPIAYSLDPKHYSPRCVPCHKRFDLDRIDSANHCKTG